MIAILIVLGITVALVMFSLLTQLQDVRWVDGQEHFGEVGLGNMVMSGVDAFSAVLLPTLIEPTIILTIKDKTARRILQSDIDDIIVWDLREWLPEIYEEIDVTGGEDALHQAFGGVVKENFTTAVVPNADTIGDDTRSGGVGAQATGQAVAGVNVRSIGNEPVGYLARWEFWRVAHEEQAATSALTTLYSMLPKHRMNYSMYPSSNGVPVHKLLTARHYHWWTDTLTAATAAEVSLGMEATRKSIDIEEVMLDRGVFLSLLDALVIAA